jgi:hypothetical protein
LVAVLLLAVELGLALRLAFEVGGVRELGVELARREVKVKVQVQVKVKVKVKVKEGGIQVGSDFRVRDGGERGFACGYE